MHGKINQLKLLCWRVYLPLLIHRLRHPTPIFVLPKPIFSFFHAGLMRRLADFRAVNTEDETVLNYFDELEIHPDRIGECSQMSFAEGFFKRRMTVYLKATKPCISLYAAKLIKRTKPETDACMFSPFGLACQKAFLLSL